MPASRPTSHSLLPYGNNKFNTSSKHLVSKLLCAPEYRSFNHEINESVFESITSGLQLHASFKPSSRNIYELKFKHLKNSRFVSVSFIFRKRSTSSRESDLGSTSKPYSSFSKCSTYHEEEISAFDSSTKSSPVLKTNPHHSPSNSSSSHSPTTEEGTSPHHNSKKILGTSKTLDLSICKNKSSPKTKSIKTSSPTCYSRSTLRSRCPTLTRLVDGEQPLYFISVFLIFIILLLLCFFALKLLHLPFNRGKDSVVILLC